MTKKLSCSDTAKLIRQSLKESFAGKIFSVKSRSYSGGASIRVGWIDGPNVAQVEAVVKRFSGSYFDGMSDLRGSKYHMIGSEQVSFGNDFLFFERTDSNAAIEKAIARVFRDFAGNFVGSNIERPTAADFRAGRLHSIQIPKMNAHHMHDLQYFVRMALAKSSDRLHVIKSPTASKVFQTHTDGHGQSDFDLVKAEL